MSSVYREYLIWFAVCYFSTCRTVWQAQSGTRAVFQLRRPADLGHRCLCSRTLPAGDSIGEQMFYLVHFPYCAVPARCTVLKNMLISVRMDADETLLQLAFMLNINSSASIYLSQPATVQRI
ncbi:hypothetical protein XENORESO_009626 [Xenotaenia resolanae]|uniref:Secreted protein n=1 Tax=Xenotaenia resolanae TaxID=208358 RepID=A0ABV0WDR9_9TELE